MNIANELKSSQLYELLEQIQLEKFWPALRDAQITQISHFGYVKPKDLESMGMSKPAVRRLLDSVSKYKKQPPARPAPPIPTVVLSNESKLYNKNLNNTMLTNKMISLQNKKSSSLTSSKSSIGSKSNELSLQPVSVLINANDIQMLKNEKGHDEVLGVGNFGIVKEAVWNSHNGSKIHVAVKCLHNATNQAEAFNELMNEISCMCGLDHRNLIKLFGIVLATGSDQNVMMVTELAANGSLYSYLKKKREIKKLMPLNKLYSYIFQIASGMEYLEQKKLIHRDLAARNILLYTFDHLKICDFGMTRSVKNEQNEIFTMKENHKIPAAWFPPESIKDKLFSIKSDVWMFGVTAWEVFTLCQHPWPNMSASEILKNIDTESRRLPLPYVCSKHFYSIIFECWSKNPAKRPSFEVLRKLIQSTKIIEMKAKTNYKEENRLEIEVQDTITIVDGDASKYWWKGQNKRTLQCGYFPRAILNPQRKLDSQDISLPLKNSFIHTGHMSAGEKDKTWGNPGKIDPIFLMNPMNPPDLLIDLAEEEENFRPNETNSEQPAVQIVNGILNNHIEDLIDLDFQVSYPDYSSSIDSFYESNNNSIYSVSNKTNTPIQPLYVNDQFNGSSYNYNSNIDSSRIYYNDNIRSQISSYQSHQYSTSIASNLANSIQPSISKEFSPFPTFQTQTQSNNSIELPKSSMILDSKKNDLNASLSNKNEPKNIGKLNVDDFLNKVINDVLKDDFKSLQINK